MAQKSNGDSHIFEVRDFAMEQLSRELGQRLAAHLGNEVGFALFLFKPFDINGNLHYISSAERKSMMNVLKKFLQRQGVVD